MATKNLGWVNDPVMRDQGIAKMLDSGVFRSATPLITGTWDGKSIDLTQAMTKVFGKILDPWAQLDVGACVGFGWALVAQVLLCVQIAKGARAKLSHQVCPEAIYGGSRVEIGGGRIGGDGSVGSWAADWVSKYGIILYQKYGNLDLTGGYSTQRARQWGSRGVPDEIEDDAKLHAIKTVTQVKSANEAADLIANGYPVSVCSNRGFKMKLNSDGTCDPSGTWNHCMAFPGVGKLKGETVFKDVNSWDKYLQEMDVTMDDGNVWHLNGGEFLVRAEVVDSMLRQGDSFAVGHAMDFETQELNWVM
jgi:hypothetical protein